MPLKSASATDATMDLTERVELPADSFLTLQSFSGTISVVLYLQGPQLAETLSPDESAVQRPSRLPVFVYIILVLIELAT